MSLDIDLVLVAVDSSDQSQEAADRALAVAAKYGADVHLLHFVDHRIMQGVQAGDISASTVAKEQQSVTAAVQEKLREFETIDFSHSTTTGFSKTRLGQTPGSVILDVADDLDADFLVVPRETPSGEPDEVVGKAALHVIEYASQPVLSV